MFILNALSDQMVQNTIFIVHGGLPFVMGVAPSPLKPDLSKRRAGMHDRIPGVSKRVGTRVLGSSTNYDQLSILL